MNSIEVCLSPALFSYKATTGNFIVVIVDVLRATTSFCSAFDSGVKTVIPVSDLEELLEYKKNGFLTAAERDGNKVDFTDFGNSPTMLLQNDLSGRELAYSTTNGTQAVELTRKSGNIAIAAFSNLNAIAQWLNVQQKNIVILCSGWKNTFSFEDTLCAGALVEVLKLSGGFSINCDASLVSLTLWHSSKNNLAEIIKNASHYQRLITLGQYDDLQYCFRLNCSKAVPVWNGRGFVDLSLK